MKPDALGTTGRFDSRDSFLVSSIVQPGDIILMSGKGSLSKDGILSSVIALGSGGKFTHAAIVVDRVCFFEADDSGSGYTFFEPVTAFVRNKRLDLLRLPYRCEHLAVYRHCDENSTRSQFKSAMHRICSKYYGDPYSKLERLLNASILPRVLKPLLRKPLKLLDGRPANSRLPGIFCSELVASVYREIGLELFDPPRAPDRTSPNDLADQNQSKLKLITDAIPDFPKESEIKFVELIGRPSIQPAALRDGLKNLSDGKEQIDRSSELTASISELTKLIQEQSIRKLDDLVFHTISGMVDTIESAGSDVQSSERVTDLLSQFIECYPSALRVISEMDTCTSDDVVAGARLYEVAFEYFRNVCLRRLRILRKLRKNKKWQPYVRTFSITERERRKIISRYLTQQKNAIQTVDNYRKEFESLIKDRVVFLPLVQARSSVRLSGDFFSQAFDSSVSDRQREFARLEMSCHQSSEKMHMCSDEVISTAIELLQPKFPSCCSEGQLEIYSEPQEAMELLKSQIRVFAGEAPDIIWVEFTGHCVAEDAIAIVDAIVDAYLFCAEKRAQIDAARSLRNEHKSARIVSKLMKMIEAMGPLSGMDETQKEKWAIQLLSEVLNETDFDSGETIDDENSLVQEPNASPIEMKLPKREKSGLALT